MAASKNRAFLILDLMMKVNCWMMILTKLTMEKNKKRLKKL